MRLKEKIRRSKLASNGYERDAINVICRRGRARRATPLYATLKAWYSGSFVRKRVGYELEQATWRDGPLLRMIKRQPMEARP